jgi:hypothetical protein
MLRHESGHVDNFQRLITACFHTPGEFLKQGAFSGIAPCLTSSAKTVRAEWIPLCPTLATPSVSFDWECAESMELHKFFLFLDQHEEKICSQGFRQIQIKLHSMRRMVTSIRHAAVHRIVQDRKSFLGMLQAAVAFTRCIADDKCMQQLGYLCISLDTSLAKLNERSHHVQERIRFQTSLCQSQPKELMQRRVLLPDAIKKVTEQNEQTFTLQVQEFVRKKLC